MSTSQDEIGKAIEIVKERGLILPNREGGTRLDSHIVEEALADAVDDEGEVNPFVLEFAREIIANA